MLGTQICGASAVTASEVAIQAIVQNDVPLVDQVVGPDSSWQIGVIGVEDGPVIIAAVVACPHNVICVIVCAGVHGYMDGVLDGLNSRVTRRWFLGQHCARFDAQIINNTNTARDWIPRISHLLLS